MRAFILVCLILLCTLIVLPSVYTIANSKTLSVDEKEIAYTLPYPGLLSDHPLYVFKKMRDSILFFTTRDMLKKAMLYKQVSDKHISMAIQLSEKGKEELAIKELTRAEDYGAKIPVILKESKKQGVSPTNDFIMELYQSNAKHKEVITEILKKTTQPNVETFNTLLEKNEQIKNDIGSIQ